MVESLGLSVNRWERIRPPVDKLAKRWAVERGTEFGTGTWPTC